MNKKIKAKVLFVSNNFRFGNKREGDINLLKSNEIKYNYKLIIPQPLKKNNKIISSTKIRKLLSNGNLKLANKYLTRKWEIEGKVQKGEKLEVKLDLRHVISILETTLSQSLVFMPSKQGLIVIKKLTG